MNDREKENGEKISVAKDFRIGRRLPYFGRALHKSGEDCPISGGHSANRAKTAPFRAGTPQIGRRLPYFGRAFRKSGGQSRKNCKGIPVCFILHPFYFLLFHKLLKKTRSICFKCHLFFSKRMLYGKRY